MGVKTVAGYGPPATGPPVSTTELRVGLVQQPDGVNTKPEISAKLTVWLALTVRAPSVGVHTTAVGSFTVTITAQVLVLPPKSVAVKVTVVVVPQTNKAVGWLLT